jgi:PIN domain nuclease of toxin-antitoxin system
MSSGTFSSRAPSLILTDTHVFLWIAEGRQVGDEAQAAVERAYAAESLFASCVSAWEFGVLTAKGRLTLSQPLDEWWSDAIERCGFKALKLDTTIAIASTRLPGNFHADPADRFLVATARHFDLPLVTADKSILAYAKAGHLKAIRAR